MHSEDGSKYLVYAMTVFNGTDSSVCILFSFFLTEASEKHVYALDPVIDCNNDTLKYYCFERCEDWDIGYLPLPAKPILINPNTYLKTNFAIKIIPDRPRYFHLHYANITMSFNELMKAYESDHHYWQNSLPIKCRRYLLPN